MAPETGHAEEGPLPRSTVPQIVWPAPLAGPGARALALQFQLEQSQWWPPERLHAHQLLQLAPLLRHAAATVPHYRDRLPAGLLDAAGAVDPARWRDIPILTRAEVQRAGSALTSTAPPPEHGRLTLSKSSGSTGRPVEVYGTALGSELWRAFTLREHLWHRRDLTAKLAVTRHLEEPAGAHPNGQTLATWGPSTDAFATGPLALISLHIDVATQAEFLLREDPDYLLGSPSNLLALCDHFSARGLRLPRLRQIRTFNEMLTQEVRDACRRVFGVEIVDMYSIGESGYLALQCPHHQHYHVQSEGVLLEVLDEQDRPCAPGESGRVVVTPLHNFATVLLRYEVGDYAEVGEPCSCGRGLPVLKRILGRFRNMAVLPGGRTVWPFFGQFDMRAVAPSLGQLQIVQRSLEELEMRYVGASTFTAEEEAGVAAIIVRHMGHPFRVTFTRVDKIPRSPTGKFEDFVCEVPRPAPALRPEEPRTAADLDPVPRSAVPGIVWPAASDDTGARSLALQFQLAQSQWWPAERLLEHQHRQLAPLLRHTVATVPHYRDILPPGLVSEDGRIDPALWDEVPILTRAVVQESLTALTSTAVPPEHGPVRVTRTSGGSTGRPLEIAGTSVGVDFWKAFTLRDHQWHRRDLSAKLASIRHLSGRHDEFPDGFRQQGWGQSTDDAYRSGFCSVIPLHTDISKQVDWLLREDPDYLMGFPSILLALTETFEARGLKLSRLREVRTYSEMVTPEIRAACRRVWGAPVVDIYSTAETGYVALQCPDHEHYHVQSEGALVEILDDDGRPCAPGEVGRVIITPLHNFAMVLLRYEVGDYARVGAPCPCGRGLPVIDRILGRYRNLAVLPDGRTWWPLVGQMTVRDIAPIGQIQVVQRSLETMELRYTSSRPLDATEEAGITRLLLDSLGHPFAVTLTRMSAIPRSPGGKFEDFICEVPASARPANAG